MFPHTLARKEGEIIMVNTDPNAPEYEFDWQNPDRKKFDLGKVLSQAFTSLFASPRPILIATGIGLVFTVLSAILMTSQVQGLLDNSSPEAFMLSGAYWGWTGAISLFGLLLTVWFQLVVVQTSYASATDTAVPNNLYGRALRLTVPMFVIA